jgi:hypothetical protein
MRIDAIIQHWFPPVTTPSSHSPNTTTVAHALSAITGQSNLQLTSMNGVRAGQQLNRCIESMNRFLKPDSPSIRQQPFSRFPAQRSISEDISEISKKVSHLDVKKMVRSQQSLREMLDISRTVLRLSYAVKNRNSHSCEISDENVSSQTTMIAEGLAEVALSLVDDIVKQAEVLFRQDSPLLNNDQKEIFGKSMLKSLKEDKELCKKLFDAGALPKDIHTKAEALQLLEVSIHDLHKYLKNIIENTDSESFSNLISASKSMSETMAEHPSPLRFELAELMQKTAKELEEQYDMMRELEAKLWYFMDAPKTSSRREDDLFSWLYYLLSTARDPAFLRMAEDSRLESLERIALPDYHFDLE